VKATFETRVTERSLYPLFDDIASLMSHIEHRLYVELYVHHRDANDIKREALVTYGITGRQFNGVSRVLAGKVSASIESMKLHRSSLEERVASAKSWLKKKDEKITSLTKAIATEERRIHPKSKRVNHPALTGGACGKVPQAQVDQGAQSKGGVGTEQKRFR